MPEKGTTIAQAYVQIMPSMEGIKGNLEAGLSGPLDSAGKSAGARLGGFFLSGLKTAAVAGTAALAAAAGGVAALTKQAVSGYADYEQLVGGVETLFKESAGQVQQYAAEAYKTAGLSANEYMETVTSFSASLLQSLGGDTKAAAEMADLAITDMSDNANKMGSSMESIQNAYQGFAKQNYSMLDNLKLGYGGTSQEMFRLMSDAAALNEEFAKTADFSIDAKGHLTAGYADIVKAIHIVQTEMGITGTTAEEAAKTVSGSLGMLKGAWANLVTGMADPAADLDKLIGDVVDSAGTAAENLLPVIEHALTGIGRLVEKLAPIVAEKLPQLVQEILPPILRAAGQLVSGIAAALPSLVQALADAMPDILTQLGRALMDAAPKLAEAATHMLRSLADFLVEAMPQIAAAIPVIIKGIVKFIIANLPALLEAAMAIVGALAMGLIELAADLLKAGAELAGKVGEGIKNAAKNALQWGRDLISNFIQGIKDKLADLWETIKGVGTGIRDFLGFSEPKLGPLSDFHTYAPDMMELFAQGIRDNAHLLPEAIESSFDLEPVIRGTVDTGALTAPGGAETAGGELAGILALLARYLPQAANTELLLDGDTLVGGTLDRTDSALGQIEIRRRREGYAPAG